MALLIKKIKEAHPRLKSATLEVAERHRFLAAFRTALDGILFADGNGRITDLNPAAERILRVSKSKIIGSPILRTLFPPKERAACRRELLPSRQPHSFSILANRWQTRAVRASASSFPAEITAIHFLTGGKWNIVLHIRDLTARKIAEDAAVRLTAIVECSQDAIVGLDLNGSVSSWNPGAESMLGYPAAGVLGQKFLKLVSAEQSLALKLFLRSPKAAKLPEAIEASFKNSSGDRIDVSITASKLVNANGQTLGTALVARDISQQKLADNELRAALQREQESARVDLLTKARNRRAFFEVLKSERARSLRYQRPLTLAYIDLDNFKSVNDKQGHAMGDELLVTTATVLQRNLRSSDCLARLGGDEFGLVLPETSAEAAKKLLQKLKRVLAVEMRVNDWPVTFSCGAATFIRPTCTEEKMVQLADEEMYKTKLAGKDAIRLVEVDFS